MEVRQTDQADGCDAPPLWELHGLVCALVGALALDCSSVSALLAQALWQPWLPAPMPHQPRGRVPPALVWTRFVDVCRLRGRKNHFRVGWQILLAWWCLTERAWDDRMRQFRRAFWPESMESRQVHRSS